jgi:predicted ATP-grasp superfamily ATP-dependent carboligase
MSCVRVQKVGDKRFDALVLNASLRQSLATVRSLGRRGLDVALAGTQSHAPAASSRWCREAFTFPDENDANAYLDCLENWLDHHSARLLIPLHDGTISLLRRHRSRIERRIRIALAEDPALATAVNKERTYAMAAELGIKRPRQAVITSADETPRAIREIGLPAVVKPCESWIQAEYNGIRIEPKLVVTEAEAWSAVEAITVHAMAVQFQQLLSGRREAVSFLYAHGRVQGRFAQWALRMQPPLGGASTLRQSIDVPDDIGAQAEALVRAINLEGYSEVEFRRDAAGIPYLMEINPRLSASVEIAVRAGVDFPLLLYQWAVGEPMEAAGAHRAGIWMRHLGGDIESTIASLHMRGRPGIPAPGRVLLDFALSFCRLMAYDYFQWHDPIPAFFASFEFGFDMTQRLLLRMERMIIWAAVMMLW